jgi:hypothetical protein
VRSRDATAKGLWSIVEEDEDHGNLEMKIVIDCLKKEKRKSLVDEGQLTCSYRREELLVLTCCHLCTTLVNGCTIALFFSRFH